MKKIPFAFFLFGVGIILAFPAAAITLKLIPDEATVTVGDAVSVDVVVSGLGNGDPPSVGAFDLDVAFDESLLSPVDVIFDIFLGDPLLFESLTDFDFSTAGIVDFAAVSLLPSEDLNSMQPSSFRLATLLFEGISAGTNEFAFTGDVRVDDALGNKFTVPEPSTLGLLALGLTLAGLAVVRRSAAGLSAPGNKNLRSTTAASWVLALSWLMWSSGQPAHAANCDCYFSSECDEGDYCNWNDPDKRKDETQGNICFNIKKDKNDDQGNDLCPRSNNRSKSR